MTIIVNLACLTLSEISNTAAQIAGEPILKAVKSPV